MRQPRRGKWCQPRNLEEIGSLLGQVAQIWWPHLPAYAGGFYGSDRFPCIDARLRCRPVGVTQTVLLGWQAGMLLKRPREMGLVVEAAVDRDPPDRGGRLSKSGIFVHRSAQGYRRADISQKPAATVK